MMRMLLSALACGALGQPAFASDPPPAPSDTPALQGWLDITPTPYGPVLVQQGMPPPYRDYPMSRVLSLE